MQLSEKKAVMVIAPENFRDEEYFHTKESLDRAGIEVSTASTQSTAISAIDKEEVETDLLISEIGEEFDAIVLVGGAGAKTLFENKELHKVINDYFDDEKIVAAICIAPLILAHAGILKDKDVTVWEGSRDDLIDFGANYTAKKVEIDENIITANGPQASFEFGEEIAKALQNSA